MTVSIDWLGVLAIRGSDAVQFSHSQLANDVKALPDAQWHWNALLQIQGRVLALVLLVRLAENEVLLLLPREIREDVRNTLARYVLRSRVRIEADDGFNLAGMLAGPTPGSAAPGTGGPVEIRDGAIELHLGGRFDRRLRLEPYAPGPREPAVMAPKAADGWRAADIVDGVPWIRSATAAEFIPQALALDRLGAFSVSKGCYPGQEIVARTHFLGRNKRALRRVSGAADSALPEPGARLRAFRDGSGDPVASVVDAVRQHDGSIEGLCVARDRDLTEAWLPGPEASGRFRLDEV